MSWQRPLATLDLRGVDADFHSHNQKQDSRWLDKINIKTYSAPAFNISVNCHNFSESKVKVETGGLKLSYCSQTSLSRNGWPKAVILLVIIDLKYTGLKFVL